MLFDRRNKKQRISLLLVMVPMAVSFVMAAAGSIPRSVNAVQGTGEESLAEHSTAIIDVMAYLILALCSGLVALVLWNIRDIKESARKHHEEIKKELRKKVSIQVHNSICEKKIEIEPD